MVWLSDADRCKEGTNEEAKKRVQLDSYELRQFPRTREENQWRTLCNLRHFLDGMHVKVVRVIAPTFTFTSLILLDRETFKFEINRHIHRAKDV